MSDDDRTSDAIERQLRAAVPPWRHLEPERDLWPRMLRRLGQPPVRFGWLEWVIVMALALALAIYPRLIPVVLYHL